MGMFGYKTLLRLEGAEKPYTLGSFSFNFVQNVGLDGNVQGEVRSGVMEMMFENLPTTELCRWMLMPRHYRNGCVTIYGENSQVVQTIVFMNAKCVGMDVRYMETGNGYCMTNFAVQCQTLTVEESSVDNCWNNVMPRDVLDFDVKQGIDFENVIKRRPDGNVLVELKLPGSLKGLPLTQVSLSFFQNVDRFGEPQSEPFGGQTMVSIDQIPGKDVLAWAAGSKKKSGEIVFYNQSGTHLLRIMFEEAYCVCFKEESGNGASCTFTISPRRISLNEVLLDNNWKE